MRRTGNWTEALFLLAVFLIYLWTAAPFLYWRDSPEFVDAVATLGIAHPAGFPTYNLLARLTCLIPLGNIPFRINLFSVLCALGALGIFLRTSRWLLEAGGAGESEARLISLSAAGILAVGRHFWGNALSAEVYALHLLFVALVLHLALRWYLSSDDRFLYLCALIYGLSAGNHATVVFLLPGLLILFCAKNREDTLRKLLLLGVFFLIGFSVYLYLPIRSSTFPNMDCGETRTIWKLFMHMTDRKDADVHSAFLTGGYWGLGEALAMQGKKLLEQVTLVGVALALLGFSWNMRRFPLVLILLVFVFVPHGFFFIHWTNESIHLQLFLVLGFWTAMGMRQLIEWGGSAKLRSIRPGKILIPLVIAVLIMQVALNYPRVDLSDDRRVEYSFRKNFMAMDPDALAIVTYLWCHYRTYQDVMRLREDITVLVSTSFISPEHLMRVTPRQYPRIPMPEGDFKQGEPLRQFMYKLVAMNLDQRRPVYLEIYRYMIKEFFQQVLPDKGFLFRFTLNPVKRLDPEIIDRYILSIRERLLQEVETGGLLRENEVCHYYIWFFLGFAEYLTLHNDWGNVLRLLEFVEEFLGPMGLNVLWPWERSSLENYIAVGYINTGQYERAKHLLEELASRCSYCYADYRNLAWLYYREGRFDEARVWMRKAMAQKPVEPKYLEFLGDIETASGKYTEAVKAYRRALQDTTDTYRKKVIERKIQRLSPPEMLK